MGPGGGTRVDQVDAGAVDVGLHGRRRAPLRDVHGSWNRGAKRRIVERFYAEAAGTGSQRSDDARHNDRKTPCMGYRLGACSDSRGTGKDGAGRHARDDAGDSEVLVHEGGPDVNDDSFAESGSGRPVVDRGQFERSDCRGGSRGSCKGQIDLGAIAAGRDGPRRCGVEVSSGEGGFASQRDDAVGNPGSPGGDDCRHDEQAVDGDSLAGRSRGDRGDHPAGGGRWIDGARVAVHPAGRGSSSERDESLDGEGAGCHDHAGPDQQAADGDSFAGGP